MYSLTQHFSIQVMHDTIDPTISKTSPGLEFNP